MPRRGTRPLRGRSRRRAERAPAGDRHLLRQVGDLPRRRRPGGRLGAVHCRPPPRLGGEPGGMEAPRPDPGRSGDEEDGHAADLPPDDPRRRPRRHGGRGRGRLTGDRPALVDDAGPAVHRRGHGPEPRTPTTEAWARRVQAGGLLAIHDVFPDPAEGGRAAVRDLLPCARVRMFVEDRAVGSCACAPAPPVTPLGRELGLGDRREHCSSPTAASAASTPRRRL